MTDPEEAANLVKETSVDSLAVAIGNAHGFVKEKLEPDFERLKKINALCGIPLILHGASDWENGRVAKAIEGGITCFNVDTAVRVSFINNLINTIHSHGDVPFDIKRVYYLYDIPGGEDRGGHAHKTLQQLIVAARNRERIETTGQLDRALRSALPKYAEHKFLAKVYQALRIEVNHEMRSLEKFLEGATESLKEGGRLVVITYHSLEDRMVKNFIKTGRADGREEKDLYGNTRAPLRPVNRKPILPTEEEIAGNTRARSAKLRIAEKIGKD